MPLATFTITTGGVITLTNARSWINAATDVTNDMIRNSAGLSVIGRAGSTTGNVADITAGSDKTVLRRNGSSLEWGQAGSDWIADGAITTAKIVNDAVTADKVADGAITAGKLGADAVDDTKLGNRAPQFYRRQGGDASDWSTAGTATQTPTTVRMQAGAVTANFGSGSNVSVTVTFPTAFSNVPLVFGVVKAGTSSYSFSLICTAVSTTQATFYATCSPAGAGSRAITWLAIGPE
jgi:hypothetical protein